MPSTTAAVGIAVICTVCLAPMASEPSWPALPMKIQPGTLVVPSLFCSCTCRFVAAMTPLFSSVSVSVTLCPCATPVSMNVGVGKSAAMGALSR